MEDNLQINNSPDTASSVLELFSTSKDSVIMFSDNIIDAIREGRVDVLRVKALCKAMVAIAERIDGNTKSEQANEAAKHGEKPFLFAGTEMHYCPVHTKYDFNHCGDPVYDELQSNLASIKALVDARETFLRGIIGTEILTDKETGETRAVKAPLKRQTLGVKVTLK